MVSHYMESNRYLKTCNIITFATGMSLGKESLRSLFVTHLLSLGDAEEELREEKKEINDPTKTPCKHVNQTS